jgi:hypothetical protein
VLAVLLIAVMKPTSGEYRKRVFIDDGWRDFANGHGLAEGDTVIVSCTGDTKWDVSVFGADGCQKDPLK